MRTSAKPSRPKSTPNVDFASEARVDFDADSDVDVFDKGSRRLREETTKLDYFDAVPAYHVDYDTLVRTPKPVVAFYREVAARNAVTPSTREAGLDVFGQAAREYRVEDW